MRWVLFHAGFYALLLSMLPLILSPWWYLWAAIVGGACLVLYWGPAQEEPPEFIPLTPQREKALLEVICHERDKP